MTSYMYHRCKVWVPCLYTVYPSVDLVDQSLFQSPQLGVLCLWVLSMRNWTAVRSSGEQHRFRGNLISVNVVYWAFSSSLQASPKLEIPSSLPSFENEALYFKLQCKFTGQSRSKEPLQEGSDRLSVFHFVPQNIIYFKALHSKAPVNTSMPADFVGAA